MSDLDHKVIHSDCGGGGGGGGVCDYLCGLLFTLKRDL